jgi:hypothetical protein
VESARKTVSPSTRTNNARPPARSIVSGEVASAATVARALPKAVVDVRFRFGFAGTTRCGFFGGLLTTAGFGVRVARWTCAGGAVGGGVGCTKD